MFIYLMNLAIAKIYSLNNQRKSKNLTNLAIAKIYSLKNTCTQYWLPRLLLRAILYLLTSKLQ
jgi:hypothetical protein